MTEYVERRKHKRYKANERTYILSPDSKKIGDILNISLGGLAFQYYVVDNEDRSDELSELNISVGGLLYLVNIPFQTVFDYEIDNDLSFSTITKRIRGIQFGALNVLQLSRLKRFIQKYTEIT